MSFFERCPNCNAFVHFKKNNRCSNCGKSYTKEERNSLKVEKIMKYIDEETLKMKPNTDQYKTVVTVPTKSVGIAILLTIIFGTIGMLYSTISGAIIMGMISLIAGVLTVGFSLLITQPICIIWVMIATKSYNRKLLSRKRKY